MNKKDNTKSTNTHGRFDKVGFHHMTVNTRHCLWIPGEKYNDLADIMTNEYELLRSYVNTGRRVPMYYEGVSVKYSEDLNKPGTCTFNIYARNFLITTNTVCLSSEISKSLWSKVNRGIPVEKLPCPGMPWLATEIDWWGSINIIASGEDLLWIAGVEASIALSFATDPLTLKRLEEFR